MKQVLSAITTAVTLFVLPLVSFADSLADGSGSAGDIGNFLGNVLGFINLVLLPVILGLAFLMFVWGIFQFFILGGSDEEAQQKGKSLMIYAIAGFVLILSFYGIVSVVTNGLGFGNKTGADIGAPGVPTTI